MNRRPFGCLLATSVALASALPAGAQQQSPAPPATSPGAVVVCESKVGERRVCPAETDDGLTLVRSFGPEACELGRTWGWDETGVWVSEGCSGEFSVAAKKTIGRYTPGSGMKVADTEHGDLTIRVFTYVRYLNQQGLEETYTDAFGETSLIDAREDFQVNKVSSAKGSAIWRTMTSWRPVSPSTTRPATKRGRVSPTPKPSRTSSSGSRTAT